MVTFSVLSVTQCRSFCLNCQSGAMNSISVGILINLSNATQDLSSGNSTARERNSPGVEGVCLLSLYVNVQLQSFSWPGSSPCSIGASLQVCLFIFWPGQWPWGIVIAVAFCWGSDKSESVDWKRSTILSLRIESKYHEVSNKLILRHPTTSIFRQWTSSSNYWDHSIAVEYLYFFFCLGMLVFVVFCCGFLMSMNTIFHCTVLWKSEYFNVIPSSSSLGVFQKSLVSQKR